MLQRFICTIENNSNCLLCWVENHSIIIGAISAAIVSSLWFLKYLKQKRAEAFFGFYTSLLLQVKSLRHWLDSKNLLDIDDKENGNIFSLIYVPSTLSEICPGFCQLDDIVLIELKEIALLLKSTLLNSENNVYPKRFNKKAWYENQYIILSFCDFVMFKSMRNNTNKAICDKTDGVDETVDIDEPINNDEARDNLENYKHILKCKELLSAINYIQKALENVKY